MLAPVSKCPGIMASDIFLTNSTIVLISYVQIAMEMSFSNKAMQPMSGFGIQLNKNSFGLIPAQQLNVPQIPPNQVSSIPSKMLKVKDQNM